MIVDRSEKAKDIMSHGRSGNSNAHRHDDANDDDNDNQRTQKSRNPTTVCASNHPSKDESESPYPSSSNIPFPFPAGPYKQQAALMDAMLQTLELIDGGDDYDDDVDIAATQMQTKSQTQANVMMLESPTGTGKSLSLACAALAWLKHRERLDLASMVQDNETDSSADANVGTNIKYLSENENNDNSITSTSTSRSKKDKNQSKQSHDWLNAWAPPEQIQRQKTMQENRNKCKNMASSTRRGLEQELDLIRKSVRKEARTMAVTTTRNRIQNNPSQGDKQSKNEDGLVLRRARENMVKVAIHRKRMEESQSVRVYQRYRYSKGKDASAQQAVSAGKKRERGSSMDVGDRDFCLEPYNPDNDSNAFGDNYHDYDNLDSSDDNNDNNENDDGKDGNRYKRGGTAGAESPTHMNKKKMGFHDLLNGGKLDGSGFHSHPNKDHSRIRQNEDYHHHGPTTEPPISIGDVQPGSGVRKIVYAARTHSQLSQFVGEIRRTAWGGSVRVITLGGRKLLCGNTQITGHGRQRRSEAFITEKCLDMQKGIGDGNSRVHAEEGTKEKGKKKKSALSCPLLEKDLMPTLAMHMLAKPSDIEDLAGLGKKSNACSYYASREALKAAEVVVVPYNTLLSKSARNAVGLSLKKSLVIVDEAHNIPEALRSLSSSKLTLTIIDRATAQLKGYVGKYLSRLAGRNIFYLGQIQKFLTEAAKRLKQGRCKNDGKRLMMTATELQFSLKLGNLNLFNIIAFLEKSRLSQKLHGFNSAIQRAKIEGGDLNTEDPEFVSKHISAMSVVETFLKCLTSTQKEGRVIIETPHVDPSADDDSRSYADKVPCFRYLLLDPSIEFKNVLDEAHAVVLAGGTLRPFSHISTELLGANHRLVKEATRADIESTKATNGVLTHSNATISASLSTFTCGHVVPSSNVLLACLPKGPNQVPLDFRHSSRFQHDVCDELGESILRITRTVPHGMVVFLPSYSYEAFVVKRWRTTGAYEQIKQEKTLFREPQAARDVEATLASYSTQASSGNGAILMCVVGGKMSEGINFANEMARCVLIVGLPYPDITDPELREKMDLLDKEKQGISGREYYQNLCMRAVNQSVGRAIRHARDYAAIILADQRYSMDPRVWKGLPDWLRSNAKPTPKPFNDNLIDIHRFYDGFTTS